NLAPSVRSSRKIAHLSEDKKRLHQLFLPTGRGYKALRQDGANLALILKFLASEQTDFAL
ncbi:hypothetical protein, partial [Alkalihalobacillus alcalophilus]|uniref:hypothetical protein n=1 Tax=Alkalihalobacillus alcalophilus TaxID=1445 RepID=UPI001F263829